MAIVQDIVADNHYYYDKAADKIVGTGFDQGTECLPLSALRFVRNCGTPLLFSLSLLKPLIRRDLLVRTGVRYPEDLRFDMSWPLEESNLVPSFPRSWTSLGNW